MRFQIYLLLLGLALVLCGPAWADVSVNPIFSEGAVLQRQKPIMIFGSASPGEEIVVKLDQQAQVAKADKEGHWQAKLLPMKAGGPYDLAIRGKNKIEMHVYVGEVWLCAGQSNMNLSTSFAQDTKEDIEKSNNPNLHLFKVEEQLSMTPVSKFKGSWQTAEPKTVQDFSGVAYYFGKTLQEALKVPVGVICSSYGGTPIKVWMSEEAVAASRDNTQLNLPENFVAIREAFDKSLLEWERQVEIARAKGIEEPAKPVLQSDFYAPSSAYFGMIQPLIPYTIRGITWYQGESDTDYPYRWVKNFKYLVDDYRQRWQNPALPFVYIQLPGYDKKVEKPGESLWAELREGQLQARRLPYCYMTCIIDTAQGDPINLHPREKKPVGLRLGQVALATIYKFPLPFSGPLYDSMEIEGDEIRLHFRYADEGLIAKGGELTGFEIAGTDKKFHKAKAVIDGATVLVSCDKVPNPVAVRYGWASNPTVNLFNKANFPASPFRTDKWVHKWGKQKNS